MLLRHFLSGPQDLSFADESNEKSRRIWESLGGATAAPTACTGRRRFTLESS